MPNNSAAVLYFQTVNVTAFQVL